MRRRTALALAALSCLAPVTGLAAAGCAPAPGSPGASAATPAGSAVPGLVPLDPAAAAPELPTDAPVGRAAFAYALGDRARLVTVDGRQYALAANALAGGATQLSPDGRWLLRRDRLRDLTGTAERTLPRGFPRAWSPTGRWLLVDAGAGQLTVETATGRTVLVRTHGIGVLDDGTVVVGEGGGEGDDVGDPKVVRLRLVDAASGAERRSVTVDTRAVLPGEEDAVKGRLGVIRAWFGPDGRVLFSVSGAHDHPVTVRDGRHWRSALPGWSVVRCSARRVGRSDDTIQERRSTDDNPRFVCG